jgi:tetratricopeptide (TPR) repeat protein
MNIRTGRELLIAGWVALTLLCAWTSAALAQAPAAGFPNVIDALRAAPGCLGVETAQTSSGRRVIFAWFEGKKALVDWYHSDAHQKAMRTVFPNVPFDRKPLPDLAEDSGPILAIVSVKFAEAPAPDAARPKISSIGIELYGPLPGGIALGGRFAPAAVKVRGLRELATGTAQDGRASAAPGAGRVGPATQPSAADTSDEAIAALERAVAADPGDPAALARLGGAQLRRARTAEITEAPGWVSKGFAALDRAVQRFPEAFIGYLTRGIAASQVPDLFGRAPVAVNDLSALIRMKQERPEAVPDAVMPSVYLHLGVAHKKIGQRADARAAWERGKALYPAAAEAQAIDKELQSL